MKFIIASDIHGDHTAARTLIEAVKREGADKLIILGDILYHGPRNDLPKGYDPKAVIALLNQYKDIIIAVRGNCDAEVDQMVLDFPIMTESRYIEADGIRMFATHGHVYNQENPPRLSRGEILIHGHTHIPKCERFGDENFCLNPGSVAIPKGNYAPSYIIYEDKKFRIVSISGEEIYALEL